MNVSRRNFLKLSAGSAAVLGSSAAFAKAADEIVVPRRKFGRHDDMVSVFGVGGHTLYMSGSQKDANEIVARAVDRGVNFFDNAWDYHDGGSEEYMGIALEGHRDKVFLMSKFCNHHGGAAGKTYTRDVKGSMKMLEDSLRRLKTDHLDLWMMHQVSHDDLTDAYRADGAIEALELAKKQGKIRYAGFTGHSDANIHRGMIEGGYEWDAILMPISVLGAMDSRKFEETIPLCEEKNIALLGMKGFAGSRRTELHSRTSPAEVLSYSLSYSQVCTQLIGFDKLEYLDQAIAASNVTPMTAEGRTQFAVNDDVHSSDFVMRQHGGKYYDSCCEYSSIDRKA
ncbi:MAG: aldo/keto reductase [Lentimonas sp.]